MKILIVVTVNLLNVLLCIRGATDEVSGTEQYVTDVTSCFDSSCIQDISVQPATETSSFIKTEAIATQTVVTSQTTTTPPHTKNPTNVEKKTELEKTPEKQSQDKTPNNEVPKPNPVDPPGKSGGKSKPQQPKPKGAAKNPKVQKSTQPQNKTTSNTTKPADQPPKKVKHPLTFKSCNCDSIGGVCDVNCCCDEDCNKNDRNAFSHCEDERDHIVSSGYCFSQSVIYKNNTPYRAVNLRPGLLCIARDNLPDKIKYYTHKVIEKEESVTNILKRRKTYTWNVNLNNMELDIDRNKPYKSGSPVWIFKNSSDYLPALDILTIPGDGVTSMCQSDNTVRYLENVKTSCLRTSLKDERECETSHHLSAATYKELLVLISPKLLNSSVDFQEVYLDDTFTQVQTFVCINNKCNETSTLQTPKYDRKSALCSNTVKRVKYLVKHNGTEGIEAASLFIYLDNLKINSGMFRQHYEVTFDWVKITESSFLRSGRPGYVNNKPLITGTRTEKTVEGAKNYTFIVPRDPQGWLSIAIASSDGFCSDKRNNIMFNNNIRSECTLMITDEEMNTGDNCSALHEKVSRYIYGKTDKGEVWLSAWGDPRTEDTSAWVPLISSPQGESDQDQSASCSLTTVASYHFVYSLSGPLDNPQTKLIGATLQTSSSPVTCLSTFHCPITIITTVTFTSVTSTPQLLFPKHPSLRIHLPKDFFYPFSSSSAFPIHNSINTCILSLIVNLALLKISII